MEEEGGVRGLKEFAQNTFVERSRGRKQWGSEKPRRCLNAMKRGNSRWTPRTRILGGGKFARENE